jgi:hypothetical protein
MDDKKEKKNKINQKSKINAKWATEQNTYALPVQFILSSCISIAPADPYPSGAIFQVSRQPV